MKCIVLGIKEMWGLLWCIDVRSFFRYCFCFVAALPDIIRYKTLRYADEGMSTTTVVFRVAGKNILVPGNAFGVARELYIKRQYFPCLSKLISGETDTPLWEGVFDEMND